MLTVFVIPGSKTEKDDFRRAVDSFGEHVTKTYVLSDTTYDKVECDTEWKAFIYSDEVISIGVRDVLDIILASPAFDYYSFYRRSLDEKVSTSPRIYRSHVKLQPDAPYPVNISELKGTFILDGWVLEHGDDTGQMGNTP